MTFVTERASFRVFGGLARLFFPADRRQRYTSYTFARSDDDEKDSPNERMNSVFVAPTERERLRESSRERVYSRS